MNSIITSRLGEIRKILKENQVRRAYAFGSVCTDQFNEKSDVDILIAFDDELDPITYGTNYFIVVQELENLFQRHVDLITERTIRNPYFKKVIEQTKTPIYER